MRSRFYAIIVIMLASVVSTGCAVVAAPRYAGVYVEPLPVVVSPVIVSPGWGYGYHRHWRRW